MFFSFIRFIGTTFLRIINGAPRVLNKERLPEGNYILVAPHRAWFDMVYLSWAATPKQFCYMAKKELFKNPLLRWLITHLNAFPVDRSKPGIKAIKTPVKWLKERDISLIMFPSGTRHSQKLKGGVLLIAKMANVPIVPAVYQGPLTFRDILKRHKSTIAFGNPITVGQGRLSKDKQALILEQMNTAFQQLDNQIDPNYVYQDPTKTKKQ
ncbi:lysophospholipid acyltransferase family protein [Ligilactobacillus sp. LYQ60]|uniref:lysophospholipid acyltransferase family protein n=1 Tax=unclassified Ligilactobacillus TaxID=2767920 RepID=UPI003854F6B5